MTAITMNVSKISVRYAKALLLSAGEKKILEPVSNDMELLLSTLKNVPELVHMLESPVIEPGKKLDVMNKIFTGKVHNLTLSFIRLAILNKRDEYLTGMARMYIDLYKKEKGIKHARVTTAVPIDTETKKTLINTVRKAFNSEVELTEKIDRELIGGFILQVENQQLDASVAGQLKMIKRKLLETSYEKR